MKLSIFFTRLSHLRGKKQTQDYDWNVTKFVENKTKQLDAIKVLYCFEPSPCISWMIGQSTSVCKCKDHSDVSYQEFCVFFLNRNTTFLFVIFILKILSLWDSRTKTKSFVFSEIGTYLISLWFSTGSFKSVLSWLS